MPTERLDKLEQALATYIDEGRRERAKTEELIRRERERTESSVAKRTEEVFRRERERRPQPPAPRRKACSSSGPTMTW